MAKHHLVPAYSLPVDGEGWGGGVLVHTLAQIVSGTELAPTSAHSTAWEDAMAQHQPMKEQLPKGAQGEYPIKNTMYDLATVMSHCGKSIEVLDEYLRDARASKEPEIVDLFEKIRECEVNNCRMTKDLLDRMVKAGKL